MIRKPRKKNYNRRDNSPQNYKWQAAVKRRDGWKCRRCQSKYKLQVHHIRSWAGSPELRYILSNGITLCKQCHQAIWGNEEAWEPLCRTLLSSQKDYIKSRFDLRRLEEEENAHINSPATSGGNLDNE